MTANHVHPSTKETAFNCPHCAALTSQTWYHVYVLPYDQQSQTPAVYTGTRLHELLSDQQKLYRSSDLSYQDTKNLERLQTLASEFHSGTPLIDVEAKGIGFVRELMNIHISSCFNCSNISIWVSDRLIYPLRGQAPVANPDLPDDIRRDYNEASSILDLSPRGASALLRLCIQKLCKHLGEKGKKIDDDIGALVAKGLDARVQKALDAVRVIGNNAIHPGIIDLTDDRATAESLFKLLNLIVEKMISEPKHVDAVYSTLPAGALAAIEERDAKSLPKLPPEE